MIDHERSMNGYYHRTQKMKATLASSKKVTHKDVCTAVGKISAYLRCGNREGARKWAWKLVGYLVTLELLPARNEYDADGQISRPYNSGTGDG